MYLNETLGEYIPSFRYLVIPLSRYSNEELIGKKDELSLVMLVDKLQSAADFRTLKDLPEGYLEEIARAVSYTHLDVYKRQLHHSSAER